VCNTIVKDQDLWGHLKPHVIAAGDGLYHFGHTAHARQFRTDLKRRLAEFPAYFVYPDRFECLVMEEFREFDRWLVPMPQRRGVETHRSVREKASLPAGIGNVLCALLLPLGCALARDVQLLGFDGRRKTDQGFWSYSNAHAYPELIEELKKEFPAFFEENIPKRDPEKYIRQVHGDSLERVLLGAEKAGYRFTLLSPSTTETLQRRYKGEFLIDGTRMESSEVPNTPNMGQIQDQSGINGLRKLS
jgi:hypothetical protein